jgi:hypothetical protein
MPAREERHAASAESLLDTVSDVHWQPERDAAARVGRSTLAQLVLLGGVLLVVVASVERIPGWMLRRASDRATECIDAAREGGGDPLGCRQAAWFAVPAWTPHTRADALERRHRVDEQIAELELDQATTRRPDRERRDRAAHALATNPGRARLLHESGAFEIAAGLELAGVTLDAGHWPALAALTMGDVDAARSRIVQGVFEHHRGAVAAGALACLLGEPEHGLGLLARADESWRGEVDVRGFAEARLAIAHCGGTGQEVGLEPSRVTLPWHIEAQLIRAYDPTFQAGRRGAFGRDLLSTTWLSRTGALGGSVLAATEELGPLELLAIAAGRDRLGQWNAVDILSPHLVLAPGRYDYVPPAWIESAAARFEAAIDQVPQELSRPDLAGLPLVYELHAPPDDPPGVLRDAAFVLWRLAAVFRARAGDRPGASAALARAVALESTPRRLTLAPVQLAIEDARGALSTLDAWDTEHGPAASSGEHAIASFNRALASMSLGDHPAAYEAARRAVDLGAEVEGLDAYIDGFEWLLVATAIATDRLDDPLPLREPSVEARFVAPASWAQAIRTGDPAEMLRWRFLDEGATRAALVAEVFVVERAGALVGDPEVAADAFFSTMLPSRALARARAEAARWQGDDERARRWRDRAQVLERLMTDDHRIALAGLAGVW